MLDVVEAAQREEVELLVVVERLLLAKPSPDRIRIGVDVEVVRVVVQLAVVRDCHATTPLTLRSTIVSQSSPRSPRMASPCSLNSGARRGGAGSSPNCTGAVAILNCTPLAFTQSPTYPLATLCGSAATSSVSCTTAHCPEKSRKRS